MKSQKRKIPAKKETKHKSAQAKEAAQQNLPLDPVLMGEYHKEATQAWQATKAAFPRRFESSQAWKEWQAAIVQQYGVYKKYGSLFAASEPVSPEAARYRWDFRRGWDFRRDVELLRGGDHTKLEIAIAFLEADPWFQGSGYEKVRLTRYIKPSMLTPAYLARLQNVVLNMVDRRNGHEFRAYCRLAKKVDNADFRDQLRQRADEGSFDVRRRARWILEALAQKDTMEAAKSYDKE